MNAFRINHRTGKTTPVTLSSAKLAAVRKDFSKKFSDDFNLKALAGLTSGAKKWVRNQRAWPQGNQKPLERPRAEARAVNPSAAFAGFIFNRAMMPLPAEPMTSMNSGFRTPQKKASIGTPITG